MNKYKQEIEKFIEVHVDEMIEKLGTFVRLEGCFNEKENVERCTAWIRKEFEDEGFVCSIQGTTADRAGSLIGILGENRPNAPVLFVGHTDSVHPTGSFGPDPFRVEGGKMYGPAVGDMKGGIIIALYVVKALNSIGFNERPIKIVFAGDEEGDHIGTDADKILTEQARGALCAFNMETGQMDNALSVSRKSLYNVYAEITGIGGHSGNFFEEGRNAVHEAVIKAYNMIPLTDLEKGNTVTTSILRGGDAVAKIPEVCELAFDVRYSKSDEGKHLLERVTEIMETTYVPGTSTEYEIVVPKFQAFEATDDVLRLLDFVNQIAIENEIPVFGSKELGAASDSGNVQAAGVPILDSCGLMAKHIHNWQEHAFVESLYDRTKIWSLVILSLGKFK